MQRFAYDIIDSTNDEARRLLAAGAIEYTALITARGQTAGRGTRGRSWVSPAGAGLYISYVCRNRNSDEADADELPLTTAYTRAAGVACVEAMRDVFGIELRIKPVNDLIWNGGKIGGILTEAFIESNRLTAIIIGIGINLHSANRPMPAGTPRPLALSEVISPARLPDNVASVAEAAIVAHLVDRISPKRLATIEEDWNLHLIAQDS